MIFPAVFFISPIGDLVCLYDQHTSSFLGHPALILTFTVRLHCRLSITFLTENCTLTKLCYLHVTLPCIMGIDNFHFHFFLFEMGTS